MAYKQLMGLTERYKAVSIAVFAGTNINNPLTVESVVASLMSYEKREKSYNSSQTTLHTIPLLALRDKHHAYPAV